ncbi:MAG: homoserine kinase [Cyclobacteriaceae bacterium]
MKGIKIFAPNTVSNVGCGYDVLGFALNGFGDEVTLKKRDDSHLVIKEVSDTSIPLDPEKNVTTVAIRSLLSAIENKTGFDISIKKSIPPGSGLGSSASSSSAAVFGVNELLGNPFTKNELITFAMEGERSSSGQAHADNVAPSLLGGFVAIRSYDPLDVFNIPFPDELLTVIIYPSVEIKTEYAKKLLPKQIDLADGVKQWGNMAGLISGLMSSDFDRIGRSLSDAVAEPVRKSLIPYYDDVKEVAIENGALGFNISGSGPTMFALSNDISIASEIKKGCHAVYTKNNIPVTSFISSINTKGAHVV